tara:strand:- start:31692 stop:33101 length:1410 start_codon:yes stop_codon:yes gene_type:complete
MNNRKYRSWAIWIIAVVSVIGCDDFVEVEAPDHKIVSGSVFATEETAKAAIQGIYNEMATANFSNGDLYSITVLAGLSSDIFTTSSNTDTRYGPFQQNELSPIGSDDATANYNLWSSAYNIIYMANSVLEGVEGSNTIGDGTKGVVRGQALFIRALTYFYLTNLYGDVPLALTTDYRQNSTSSRAPSAEVWGQIAADLDTTMELLEGENDYADSERTHINLFAAVALRARVHLYQQNWASAEERSGQVIDQISLYGLPEDLDQVFLMNSREAIWQISPLGRDGVTNYTGEGYFFRGNNASRIRLAEGFLESFPAADERSSHWIGFNESRSFHFPQKYKDGSFGQSVTEYSMVLRLAEQYLIRAEARAMQGNLSGAMTDLDKIRERAGLGAIAGSDPEIGQQALLDSIMEERKRELFSEWGHRWFDLKRTGRASTVLMPLKPLWQDTDTRYPIPGEERAKNPNLGQNDGY